MKHNPRLNRRLTIFFQLNQPIPLKELKPNVWLLDPSTEL